MLPLLALPRAAGHGVAGSCPWADYILGVPYLLASFVVSPMTDYAGDYPDPVDGRRRPLAEQGSGGERCTRRRRRRTPLPPGL